MATSSMSQCIHVSSAKAVVASFTESDLEDLNVPCTHGGTANIIRMLLKTVKPPTNVAVKCFRPPNTSYQDEEETKRIIDNELMIWKLLSNNPHVVQFLGIINAHSRFDKRYLPPWPVCEYHKNKGIDYYLSSKDVSAEKRFQLLAGVLRGLVHIHSMNVVHGDLKASNVVVNDRENLAMICDFGSSRIRCASCKNNLEDQAGTGQWDSPELWDEEPRTASSDIWAFGCVALETQFSMIPYHPDDMETTKMQIKGLPPAEKILVAFDAGSISGKVWDIMQRCWKWEASDRPDAQSVLGDFEALVPGAVRDLAVNQLVE